MTMSSGIPAGLRGLVEELPAAAPAPYPGIAAALAARLRSDPARPMLTYYDDATGERTELSATTLDNWVAKTANMIVDELGLVPGDTAGIDLPAHWQTAAVLLACWSAGLSVEFPGSGGLLPPGLAAVFVAERPAAGPAGAQSADTATHPVAGDVVALSLRPFGAPLAHPVPGVVDYAAEVAAHGDRFGPPVTSPAQGALVRLAAAIAASRGLGPADRLLATAAHADARGVLGWLLVPLVAGASVVLCRNSGPDALARRVATERVTAAWGVPGVPLPGVPHLAVPDLAGPGTRLIAPP